MKRMILTFAIAAIFAQAAGAAVLHDQSAYDPWGGGFFNALMAGMFPSEVYSASDFTVDGDGWVIHSITNFYCTQNDASWGAGTVTQAYLSIWPKTGPMPTEDPTTALLYPCTVVETDAFAVTISGLNIAMSPGDYWVCLTPIAPFAMWGANFQLITTDPMTGDGSLCYDKNGIPMPMWYAPTWGPDLGPYDAAMLIEGDYEVVGNESETWGAVKSLYR